MTTKVLDNGFVRLVDHMPRENLDEAIVQAARVSYGAGTKTSRNDEGLIRYLLRNWHTTPFEMIEFKFHIKMPIYIARQHMRHRTSSINETSARYSIVDSDYYDPEVYRGQAKVNRQGSEGVVIIDKNSVNEHQTKTFELYNKLLSDGCCREQARGVLPQSTYTEFYWKINLHNLLHYLQLRMDEHAQYEIREYANAIFEMIKPLVPITCKAFLDFRINAINLTYCDIEYIKNGILPESIGEKRELNEKLEKLGMNKISI